MDTRVPEIAYTGNSVFRSNRVRFGIVAVVVVLSLAFMIWAAFGENTRYFLTVSEFNNRAEVQDGQMVRVSGKLVDGTFNRGDKSTISNFQLTDKDGTYSGSELLMAQYEGVLPDLFFNPHSEIILEGSHDGDGVFLVNEILVKCPSKYVDLEEQQYEQPAYPTT